ncbi:MAG: Maf family protein [Halioglobus sp.]
MSATPLILASASPRRAALLAQIGVQFQCEPADIDETPLTDEAAADYVARMAREKARVVAASHSADVVLAADTVVVLDGDILGKPADEGHALAMLARLSGREHAVMTGLCLCRAGEESEVVVETAVEFANLDLATCKAYLATDEPWDKAGAYAIQGVAAVFVRGIRGSYSNVVGLPLAETHSLLVDNGVATALSDGRIAASVTDGKLL